MFNKTIDEKIKLVEKMKNEYSLQLKEVAKAKEKLRALKAKIQEETNHVNKAIRKFEAER